LDLEWKNRRSLEEGEWAVILASLVMSNKKQLYPILRVFLSNVI